MTRRFATRWVAGGIEVLAYYVKTTTGARIVVIPTARCR
jgi:hypothetical protein